MHVHMHTHMPHTQTPQQIYTGRNKRGTVQSSTGYLSGYHPVFTILGLASSSSLSVVSETILVGEGDLFNS